MSKQENKQEPQGLTPTQAYEKMQTNPQTVLVDIRSTMEHLMIGHPKDSIHIAWLDEPDWTPNPRFVAKVRELLLGGFLGEDEEAPPTVILICRSGRRSIEAGRALLEAGIPHVYHVESGFEGPMDKEHHRNTIAGWRFDGLPWQQC